MVELQGKPLLAYHLEWLKANGVQHILLLTGYLHEAVWDYFGNGGALGMELQYLVEDQPLGRGGALRRGLEALPPEIDTVVASNGDVVTTQSLLPLAKLHYANPGTLATVMLTRMPSPFGILDVARDGRVRGFQEKPFLPYWINAGVYILSRKVIEWFPQQGDHETQAFPTLAREGHLTGFRSSAYWHSIETAKDLREVALALPGLSFSSHR